VSVSLHGSRSPTLGGLSVFFFSIFAPGPRFDALPGFQYTRKPNTRAGRTVFYFRAARRSRVFCSTRKFARQIIFISNRLRKRCETSEYVLFWVFGPRRRHFPLPLGWCVEEIPLSFTDTSYIAPSKPKSKSHVSFILWDRRPRALNDRSHRLWNVTRTWPVSKRIAEPSREVCPFARDLPTAVAP